MLTRKEAATYLGCTVSLLNKYAWIDSTILPYTRIGRKCMYKKDDLDKYINTKTHGRNL